MSFNSPPQGWNNNQWPQYNFNDPMLNASLQAGANIIQTQAAMAAQQYMPGVNSIWGSLRTYFNVNNSFVVNKLSTMLFPFAKKDWNRSLTRDPPSNDANAPDLYLPLMALSTYVLTVGLAKGTSMKFDPEVIVDTFGSSIMVQVVEVGIMAAALKLVGPWVPHISWFDLFAFSGYQYVGVAVNMAVGLLFGHFFYLLSLFWTASCAAFSMYRTMHSIVPPPEPGQRGRKRRMYFLVTCALLQVVFMWFLGFTRELRSAGLISWSASMAPDIISKKGADSILESSYSSLSAQSESNLDQTPKKTARVDVDDVDQTTESSVVVGGAGAGKSSKSRKKKAAASTDPADV